MDIFLRVCLKTDGFCTPCPVSVEIQTNSAPTPCPLQATQCNGLLYLATGEYWGDNSTRVPSIYWAVIKPTDDICHLSREDQGMVASDDGLALAYPVIVAAKEGGAVLAYSYSGADKMADGTLPAYPGERLGACDAYESDG